MTRTYGVPLHKTPCERWAHGLSEQTSTKQNRIVYDNPAIPSLCFVSCRLLFKQPPHPTSLTPVQQSPPLSNICLYTVLMLCMHVCPFSKKRFTRHLDSAGIADATFLLHCAGARQQARHPRGFVPNHDRASPGPSLEVRAR